MLVAAVWSAAPGWLTPPMLFVFINLVIGTIAVMSRLMSVGDGGDRRSFTRAPSAAFDRLRCFSFSRLGLPADHAAFDDGGAAEASAPDGGEWRRISLLRAPSVALDRLRGFSFSRSGSAAEYEPVVHQRPPLDGAATDDAEPSSLRPAPAEAGMVHEQAGIERSHSEPAVAEAPARRRPRARKTRMSGREERAADGHGTVKATRAGEAQPGARRHEPPAPEVDARADDFIRQFREQLWLQRLDSIRRCTGTV